MTWGDWRPIETAPKDGTRVLLVDETDPTPDAVCTGWWMEGYWRDYGDIGCNGQVEYEPTHWMPLPFGPGATTSNGELTKSLPDETVWREGAGPIEDKK